MQGGLTHAFLSDGKVKEHIDGIASLVRVFLLKTNSFYSFLVWKTSCCVFYLPNVQTGVFPSLPPFAHALAAVLTAALSGSILFMTSFPKGIFCIKG